jgi:ribosomal protein S27E
MIEIKETTEERRNRKSKAMDEKRNVNNGFMSVLCRDSDPTTDPPRTKFLRRKNSDGYKVKKVGFRNNRHVVTCEGNWLLGSMGGMVATDEL